ncbi:MAG TPA: cation diffusion facilitator family transporter [Pirellulales bacterium]|jgi:cation diffusion facilitator family transporter|nr:cation diffusion facilitator family transporter [Pirellulales bacterium]
MNEGQRTAGERTIEQVYRRTRRAALVGLLVTLGLGISKMLAGWLGHSLALFSDSVHSLGDALSSASILVALSWAERPADPEHPYGHTRIETIAASNVALLLILSGFAIVWEAIRTWQEPAPTPHWSTLVIALASVGLNQAIYRYSMSVARSTGSKAVEVAAWDQRLDVFGSLVVVLSLAIAVWGGSDWHGVDHIAALIVAGIILGAGGHLFWSSLQELMDRQAEPELLDSVRRLSGDVRGVRGVEKLFVRKSGLEHFVDIHVEVDAHITVREGHEIGHAVKARLISELTTIKDVLVHIEPAEQRAAK